MLELQRALPLARVVYCSATGCTDLSNMVPNMGPTHPNPKPKPNPNPKPKPNPNQVISLEVVNIIDVRSKTRDIGGASAFQYHVQVSSLAMIERLFEAVAALDDVVHVRRGDMLHMLHDSPDGFWAHAAERPAAEEQP